MENYPEIPNAIEYIVYSALAYRMPIQNPDQCRTLEHTIRINCRLLTQPVNEK